MPTAALSTRKECITRNLCIVESGFWGGCDLFDTSPSQTRHVMYRCVRLCVEEVGAVVVGFKFVLLLLVQA